MPPFSLLRKVSMYLSAWDWHWQERKHAGRSHLYKCGMTFANMLWPSFSSLLLTRCPPISSCRDLLIWESWWNGYFSDTFNGVLPLLCPVTKKQERFCGFISQYLSFWIHFHQPQFQSPLYSFKNCNCLAYVCSSASFKNEHKRDLLFLFVRENKNKQILEITLCKHSFI